MSSKTAPFRVGRVRVFRRGRVWYLAYYEQGERRQPRVGPSRQSAKQMASEINGQLEMGAPSSLGFEPCHMKAFAVFGWMQDEELRWLADRARKSNVIVEVGTWKGRSAAALVEHTPGVVFCVEHFHGSADEMHAFPEAATPDGREAVKRECLSNLNEWIETGRLYLIERRSVDAFALLTAVLAARRADMVFIDGEHSYEAFRQDFLLYRELLNRGGLLCGHDSDHAGIAKALTEIDPTWNKGPGSLWFIGGQE